MDDPGRLMVYDAGPTTLVGFRDAEFVDDVLLEECGPSLEGLMRESGCRTLVVDVSGVKLISSGVLGYLFSLSRRGVRVRLYNPSDSVREVLQVTRLGTVLSEADLPQV